MTTEIALADRESHGLGLFVRSLIGLDRKAATEAMNAFLAGRSYGASQIAFVKLVVDHLTEHGVMPASRLYESPFTDLTPQGPDALFTLAEVDELVAIIDRVALNAVAA